MAEETLDGTPPPPGETTGEDETSAPHAEGAATRLEERAIFRVQPLWRSFYVVARASELGSRPLAVELWGKPFVLFRDDAGRPVALLDRCAHRNVPLSAGRVKCGTVECPYHGWRFDGSGRCVEIPGRVRPLEHPFAVPSFAVRESQGLVWLCPSELGPLAEPFVIPHADDASMTQVVREVRAPASLYAVIENALDVPHTSILHRGLFRGGERRRVRVVVRRYGDRVEAEYLGEPPPQGLAARLLSLGVNAEAGEGALVVEHWDRFFAPGILQVEYRLGPGVHFSVTGLCSPVSDHETRLFAVASFRTPLPGRLLALLLEPLARLVFRQDTRMLERQTKNVLRFGGERFISTELDAVGPELWRVLRSAARREAQGLGPATSVEPEHVHELELDA